MKILYSLAGEGMGHACRSKAVIDHLSKKHKIQITTTAGAYTYLSKHYKDVTRVSGLHITYKNNKVSPLGTLFVNFSNLFEHLKTIKKTYRLIKTFKPDLIINDYAICANYLGILLGIPVINLDNNRVASKTRVKIPLKYYPSRLRTTIVTNLIAPMGYFHIVTSFFYPPLRWWHNAKLVFSPIRKEILKLKPKSGDHILVYQTSDSNKRLLEDLKDIREKFIIYGFGRNRKDGNLNFKTFNETEYFKDLESAKAVIMNGGFTLMAECLYLKKPILSIPVKGQFEQELNAIYLERLEYGKMLEESSVEGIDNFLKESKKYHKKLLTIAFDPNECLRLVDKKIEEIKKLKS